MEVIDSREPHLRDYIHILVRRRRVVYISLLAILLAVTVISLSMYPTYNSETTIQLEDEKKTGVRFIESPLEEYVKASERIRTQIEILKSRTLAERVAKKLNLQFQVEPENRMFHLFLKKLGFGAQEKEKTASLTGSALKILFLGNEPKKGEYEGVFGNVGSFTVYDDRGKEIGTGEIGSPFAGDQISFIAKGTGHKGEKFRFRIISLNSAGRMILANLNISPVRDTSIIRIESKWDNPVMAKEIVQAVLDEYKEVSVSKRTREASQVLSFIDAEVGKLTKEVVEAEGRLEKFKKEKGVITLDKDSQSTLAQIAQYEKDYGAMETYRKQAEIVLAELQKPGLFSEKEVLFSLGAGLNNPVLIELGKSLDTLNGQKAALEAVLKKDHPRTVQAEREIESLKKRIISEVRGMISTIKISEENLGSSLKKYERRLQSLPAAEKDLFEIMRVVKARQDLSSFLLQKRGEMNISKASELGNLWVVDPPIVQPDPISPNLRLNLLLSLVVGIFLSTCLAFFVEYSDTTVKTPEELQKITDLPFLGTVLHFNSDKKKEIRELKILEDPHSHIAEAFRTIRTNLLFTTLGEANKILLISSTTAEQGKTFIVANLAIAMAKLGKRVLLIDSDLRKPRLWQVLGTERSPGLTDILMGKELEFSSLPIKKIVVENLEIISSGDQPPNPSELLSSERMERFLLMAREKYDYVFLDSPPVMVASEVFALVHRGAGLILVVRKGRAEKKIVRDTLARFSKQSAKTLGVIFNDLSRDSSGYYYRYDYYYRDYYGEGPKKKRKKVRSRKSEALPPAKE